MSSTARLGLLGVLVAALLIYLFGTVGAILVAVAIAVVILRELPTEVTGWKRKGED